MEKINVAELLKDCPKGMELDCALFDVVKFEECAGDCIYICLNNGELFALTKYGSCIEFPISKCVIFPKGKNTWDGFVPPCQFKDGDIIVSSIGGIHIMQDSTKSYCHFDRFGLLDKTKTTCVRVERLATEEEKQKLFDAIKANGYKWNTETKTLEKLVEPTAFFTHKEETMEEKLEQITLDIPKGYEFFVINDDNQVVLTKKQMQYPNTFIEVMNFLHPDRQPEDDYQRCYKKDLIEKFQDLLYARYAYWKIAGEQMGLSESWKPDWKDEIEIYYTISYDGVNIKCYNNTDTYSKLAFPTKEMRDAFYKNFKELIEQCKELL